MTPKEKAAYLYTLFKQRTSYREMWHDQQLLDAFHDNAKSCAMIAVNEIIKSNPSEEDTDRGGNLMYVNNKYYWEQVKNEIEKL